MKNKYIIAIVVAVLGTFYSFLADVSTLLAPLNPLKIPPTYLKVLLSIIIIVVTVLFLSLYKGIKTLILKQLGFLDISYYWLHPSDQGKREKAAKKIISNLISSASQSKIKIASITGEWDIMRPFTESELYTIFHDKEICINLLLCHPDSDGLITHCKNEGNLNLMTMKKKICRNTEKFLELGIEVRWFYSQPVFHIISNEDILHFGYFLKNHKGHYSHRYIVDNKSALFNTFNIWFDQTWDNSSDAKRELAWVKNSVIRDKAIFLDRDGTLIVDSGYSGSINTREIKILPGVIEGLKEVNKKGYRLIIISNQQAVGLDLISQEDHMVFTKRFKDEFSKNDIYFDGIYYCTHRENENCPCRKPNIFLFEKAIKRFNLDTKRCHMIGNSDSDIKVNKNLPDIKFHKITPDNNFMNIVKNEIL